MSGRQEARIREEERTGEKRKQTSGRKGAEMRKKGRKK